MDSILLYRHIMGLLLLHPVDQTQLPTALTLQSVQIWCQHHSQLRSNTHVIVITQQMLKFLFSTRMTYWFKQPNTVARMFLLSTFFTLKEKLTMWQDLKLTIIAIINKWVLQIWQLQKWTIQTPTGLSISTQIQMLHLSS